jgi:hypothetical protein
MAPPFPDEAQPDLMLPFGAIADEAGRDVVLSGDHADAVLACCRAMGSKFGAPGYLRYLFGLPVNEALQSGYGMTQRGLRETTPHACAEEIARTALELLPDPGGAAEDRTVLNLFAGVGQMAYSYAKAGWHVQSIENDHTTASVAVRNMALAGLAGAVEYRVADGPATLASAAQVVVLNLPHNALLTQIGQLADRAGCSAVVQYQFISDFPASFSQAPAYFFGRPGPGRDGPAGVQERQQRLTLDGQRVSQ